MGQFLRYMEAISGFPDNFQVNISGYPDQPILTIPKWGYIRLFLHGMPPHYSVHMIRGEQPGAGTILYFAALLWALKYGEKETYGQIASDSTLSPDAIRARTRMQQQYADYLYIMPHPSDEVKVHRGDNTDWRRPATPEEGNMWRLKKMPPFEFNFSKY